jgi:hypothetical protein
MALTVPDVGEVLLLSYALNKTAASEVHLHLYTAIASAIDDDTVIADFTEATAAGYAAIELAGASWTVSTVGGTTTATYAEQTFTFTAASTNLGYYVTDHADTGLLWCEAFSDAPHTIPSGGGTEKVTVKIQGA